MRGFARQLQSAGEKNVNPHLRSEMWDTPICTVVGCEPPAGGDRGTHPSVAVSRVAEYILRQAEAVP